jgi:cysteinyl-tRNA synthetase
MRLYDSLSETVQALPEDSSEKALAWYTCGPTTYAPAHMGHARTYVCLDILRRVMEAHMPKAPLFVMNITDVDDKILAAAKEQKIAPIDLARRFEADFWKDLDALHCLRPHVVTRVTEYVESDIVPYIERLVDQGMAYEAEDGVYFHVRAYNERLGHITKYGKLAPPAASQDIDITAKDDKSSTTTPVMKHDPRDFVLWKKRKPDEAMAWPSPWGEGRPGWHIECSAMIEAIQIKFQDTHQFLVHAGGVDLKFPHHTNEIAQAEAYGAKEWIPHWVHTGHVHIDGLKMSKSLKNFVSIQEFLTKVDSASALESPADDFRLWCLGLSGSYRGPATFSRDRIAEARSIRQKLLRFLIEGEEWISGSQTATKIWNDEAQELFLASENARERGIEALMNDMDGSTFVDELVQVAELGNTYLSQNDRGPIEPLKAAISNLRDLLSLVGFSEKTTRAGLGLSEQGAKSSHSLGDERAVIDAMVHFRSAVRHAALEDAKGKTASPNMKKILRLCDDARNSILPKLGIELRDSNTEEGDGWRICLPRSDESQTSDREHQKSPSMDLESTPLEDFFRVGQYEGMFSEFNEDGIPIINADGFEVSKRMLKKLLKKREAHKRRLE